MNWKDIIGSIVLAYFVIRFLIYYFSRHPSDRYHNDSWGNRKK